MTPSPGQHRCITLISDMRRKYYCVRKYYGMLCFRWAAVHYEALRHM